MWTQTYPESNIDKYKKDIFAIFGENHHLKTVTVGNIFQTIGFKFGCYFKIVSVVLRNDQNCTKYHFHNCNCSHYKYCNRLLFTNKMYISDNSYTFVFFKSNIYHSYIELYGRTLLEPLTAGILYTELPNNKNLIFQYSNNENLYCILNRIVENDEYFGVEVILDKYLLTSISRPKHLQKFHLSHNTIPAIIQNKPQNSPLLNPCMCNINEKENIKFKPLGQNELMTNIQMILQSLGLYQLYEHIFTFLSRLKMISYDIETQNTEFNNLSQKLQKQRGNVVDSQHILENGTILNKLNILLIGTCTYMSIKKLKQIIRSLSQVHINEDIMQSHIKKKFHNAFLSPTFDTDILTIVEKTYDPEITLFEDVIHFFAHLMRFTRLSEYLSHILLSRLLYAVKEVKEKGMFSLLLAQLNKWIPTHYIFAFNGSSFDNILIEQKLTPYFLSVFKSKIKIHVLCNGLRCVNLLYSVHNRMFTDSNNIIKVSERKSEFTTRTNLVFRDTRKIVSRGSLNELAKVYALPINKLSFPYAFLKNKQFLQNVTPDNMFTYHELFYDVLKFRTMSDLEKKSLKKDFETSKCSNLYEYLKLYLNRDVLVLHRLMNKILDAFNELNCNIILQKKLTISSIAFSNIYIYENINKLDYQTLQLTTSKFVNNTIKKSVIGGYCCTNITDVDIDSSFVINEDLTYQEKISADVWHKLPSQPFNQTCHKLLSYDVRYF